MPVLIADLVAEATAVLAAAGVADPSADALVLAQYCRLGGSGTTGSDGHVDPATVRQYRDLVDRRGRRVPLPHLTGVVTFLGVDLMARPGVFLPRVESDVLVEEAARACAALPGTPRVVDLCTGGGALAFALAARVPAVAVVGLDISPEAVRLARENRDRLGATGVRIELGDAADPRILADLDGTVDVVVANPPYIPPDGVPREQEVRDHEPPGALFGGGADGLAIMRSLIPTVVRLLRPGGLLILQHADVQAAQVRDLVATASPGRFTPGTTHRDRDDRERYLTARRTDESAPAPDVEDCTP